MSARGKEEGVWERAARAARGATASATSARGPAANARGRAARAARGATASAKSVRGPAASARERAARPPPGAPTSALAAPGEPTARSDGERAGPVLLRLPEGTPEKHTSGRTGSVRERRVRLRLRQAKARTHTSGCGARDVARLRSATGRHRGIAWRVLACERRLARAQAEQPDTRSRVAAGRRAAFRTVRVSVRVVPSATSNVGFPCVAACCARASGAGRRSR